VRVDQPFSVRISVRAYELDGLGHVNQAVYHSYAEHARTEMMRAAGLPVDTMVAGGTAPVLLASQIRYLRELRSGDTVDVSARIRFGTGKTFTIESLITKVDGTVSAEIGCTLGVMDLAARKLVADPRGRLTTLATDPSVFGALDESAED
jgi:acyl-CoA thioester hydrolase